MKKLRWNVAALMAAMVLFVLWILSGPDWTFSPNQELQNALLDWRFMAAFFLGSGGVIATYAKKPVGPTTAEIHDFVDPRTALNEELWHLKKRSTKFSAWLLTEESGPFKKHRV